MRTELCVGAPADGGGAAAGPPGALHFRLLFRCRMRDIYRRGGEDNKTGAAVREEEEEVEEDRQTKAGQAGNRGGRRFKCVD